MKNTFNQLLLNIMLPMVGIYNYNTEFLANSYSSVGMNIRVPKTELTRICIPGTSQYCYTAQEGDTIYTIGDE